MASTILWSWTDKFIEHGNFFNFVKLDSVIPQMIKIQSMEPNKLRINPCKPTKEVMWCTTIRCLVSRYQLHEAMAEVSEDKECIGKRFGIKLVWKSNGFRFKRFGAQVICDSPALRLKRFGCQLVWDSNGMRFKWCEIQMVSNSNDFGFNCFEIQLVWKLFALRFNWCGLRRISISIDLRFNCFEIQLIWNSIDVKFNCFEIQLMWCSNELRFNGFETENMKLGNSKMTFFCDTSFNNKVWKLKNEAFLRDFFQKYWGFETQKRSLSARRLSNIEALTLKKEAFLLDFLQERLLKKRNFLPTWTFILNKMKPTNPNADTYVEKQRFI